MKNIGFNPNELRKTIVTKIDKDGFHERIVTYGKDSGGSEGSSDFSIAHVTFINANTNGGGYRVLIPRILPGDSDEFTIEIYEVSLNEPLEVDIPLYNGRYRLAGRGLVPQIQNIDYIDSSHSPQVTGGISIDDNGLVITGDGTFTAWNMNSN